MTVYDLIENMSNMNNEIRIYDDTESTELYRGEVEDIRSTDLYDDIQDAEVIDLYTLGDGTLVMCIEYENY